MFVIKRDGRKEQVHFDKITARIMKLSYGLNTDFCDPVRSHSVDSPLHVDFSPTQTPPVYDAHNVSAKRYSQPLL